MQNKFGFKDFVLMVMVVVVGLLTFMNMRQADRQWKQNQDIASKVGTVEQQLAKLERNLKSGNIALATNAGGNSGGTTASRDSSWARPGGVPIDWQEPFGLATPPYDMEDYRLGGEFTEVFEAQPAKLTPVLAEDTYGRRIGDYVYESLAQFNPKTQALEGVLAEAWQYDTNGYWLRVKLRENINFSDGVEVTAEDVRYSFHDYINNPELETESLRSILTNFEKVEAISEKVVEFTFKEPDAYNLQSALLIAVLPAHFYSQFTPTQINQSTGLLMGSGPFKINNLDIDNQWSPGNDVVLVRNEQYWADKPALASLRFRTITEDIARLTEFRNGNASMILPSSPQFATVSREPGWDEKAYSLDWVNMRSGYSFIAWQCGLRSGTKETPFHDKRVRRAMTMILDRELIINDIYNGIGEVAVGPNNPPSPAANPEITPLPYNPERASELLAEAGWVDRDDDGILENERGDEFVFEFTRASGGQTIERLQKYLIDQCASVGIRCVPRIVDWSLYIQILKDRDFDAITLAWSASAPESDPKQIWHTDSIQNQGHNFIQWDAGQDEHIDAIKATLDFEDRMAHFHEFHKLVHEEQPYTFLRVSPWLRFVDKDFKNVNTYSTGIQVREYFNAPMANN